MVWSSWWIWNWGIYRAMAQSESQFALQKTLFLWSPCWFPLSILRDIISRELHLIQGIPRVWGIRGTWEAACGLACRKDYYTYIILVNHILLRSLGIVCIQSHTEKGSGFHLWRFFISLQQLLPSNWQRLTIQKKKIWGKLGWRKRRSGNEEDLTVTAKEKEVSKRRIRKPTFLTASKKHEIHRSIHFFSQALPSPLYCFHPIHRPTHRSTKRLDDRVLLLAFYSRTGDLLDFLFYFIVFWITVSPLCEN